MGDHDLVVKGGGFLFKPRGIVHALSNPTDVEAIVIEFISPAGFRRVLPRDGGTPGDANPRKFGEIAAGYGQTPHPELIAELSELYGVSL